MPYRWGVFISSICHYCGTTGKMTTDHVVPRMLLPKPLVLLPEWYRSMLEVPSCHDCNNKKGYARSDCACETCVWLWNVAHGAGFIVNPRYDALTWPVRRVLKSPA